MGCVLISKNDINIIKARRMLNMHFEANIIYYIELDRYASRHSAIRFAVHQLSDNRFKVTETSFNCTRILDGLRFKVLKEFEYKHLARDYVESLSIQAEQNDYEYSDEFKSDIVKFSESEALPPPSKAVTALDFFRDNHLKAEQFYTQKLTGGLLATLVMDAQSNVTIYAGKKKNFEFGKVLHDCDLLRNIQSLSRSHGFRGAVIEVLIQEHHFSFTDCFFIGNKWVNDKPINERLDELSKAFHEVGLDKSLIIPCRKLQARDWLSINPRGHVKALLVKPSSVEGDRQAFVLSHSPALDVSIDATLGHRSGMLCNSSLKHLGYVAFPSWLSSKYNEYVMAAFVGHENRMPVFF